MARTLESFSFTRNSGRQVHDWDLWLNGSTWELVHGEDFTTSPQCMQAQARVAANRRGLKVRTRRNGDNIILQAIKPAAVKPDDPDVEIEV